MSKFCTNCGSKLEEGQELCLGCGALVNKENKNKVSSKKTNTLSVIGFIVSIISLILSFIPFVFVLGIISLVLSIIGVVKSSRLNDGKGLGIAGISVSICSILLSIFVSFMYFILIVVVAEEMTMDSDCKRIYGNDYEAVEGYNFTNDDDDFDWYCCAKNKVKTFGTCKRID